MADELSALERLTPHTTSNAPTGRVDARLHRVLPGNGMHSRPSIVDFHSGVSGARPRLQPRPTPWPAGMCAGHDTVSCCLHASATARGGQSTDDDDPSDLLHSPVARSLPAHLVPVLAQLLTGATDVTASQRLGMSPRTFSRRVSELLEHLGVMSRFQAGVAAVNQGWLVQRPHPPARKH